jgi:hypothetical protein
MAYIGDEAFNLFLKKIKFPRSLPELKAYSLRYIWAIQMPRMQQIFDEMKDEYRFDTLEIAEEFYSDFMALWNLLTKYQDEGNYYRFVKLPKIKTKKELLTRIFTRDSEIRQFRPLMSNDTKDISGDYAYAIHGIILEIDPALDEMRGILASANLPFEEAKLVEWETKLDSLDATIEEGLNSLGWLLVKIRRNGIPQKPNTRKSIGRNDRCSCGSGKKFEQCCLGRMN